MNALIKVQHISFLFSGISKFHRVPILNGSIYLLSLKKNQQYVSFGPMEVKSKIFKTFQLRWS